ncbi:MAG: hypothetical protein KGL35_21560 [Bradyrhizobium sp.]|nr:hypothetical protein [Bradyrhizobium sp.]
MPSGPGNHKSHENIGTLDFVGHFRGVGPTKNPAELLGAAGKLLGGNVDPKRPEGYGAAPRFVEGKVPGFHRLRDNGPS